MSDTVNTATIKTVVDASGVEVGLRKVEDAVGKTKRAVDNLGNSKGVDTLGDGATSAANKFAFGTKGIIEAIEKSTRAMELGKRGTVEYYATLGNQKGVNPAVLKPYLDQLDAVTRKTALAAEAQRKLDDGNKFVEGLRAQASEIGKSASQLAEMRAAQLGVSESAQPLIDKLREAEEASGGLGGALGVTSGALAAFAAAAAGAFSIASIVTGVTDAIGALADLDDMAQKTGSSVESLSRLQKVAQMTGQDFGAVDSALGKLAKGMGGLDEDSNKVINALKRLGISTKDIANQDPSKVLIEVASRLQNYSDSAGKAALANELIKGSGADLLPFLNDVSENIGDFAGASGQAAAEASLLQDRMGLLTVKASEFYGSLATLVLPAMTDLAGAFGDAAKSQNDLLSKDISGWADNLAVGLARVADVAVLIPRILSTITGSFKAVIADLTVLDNLNPVGNIRGLVTGGPGFKKALEDRNAVVAESNQKLADLWNKPANLIEQSMLKRLSERSTAGTMGAGLGKSIDDFGKPTIAAPDPDAKDRAAAIEKLAQTYKTLTASINERIAASAREAAGLGPVTESQKLQIDLDEKLRSGELKLADARTTAYQQQIKNLGVNEDIIASQKRAAVGAADAVKMYKTLSDAATKAIEDAVKEAERNEELAATFGMTKSAIEELALSRLEDQLSQRASLGLTLDEIANLEKLIDAKKRSAVSVAKIDSMTEGKKALDELDKFLDPARAKDFGDALSDAFGKAGSALGKLAGLMDTYGKRQASIDEQRGNAAVARSSGMLTEAGYAERIRKLNQQGATEELSSYGQMSSAAASFFGEQSKGYQALQAASQAFHAAELAMTLAELVPKGISAVLGQAEGDPYSAFARMAAMAAVVVGLGVAISGNVAKGGQTAADIQKAQGTGSVLGDSSAKSESSTRILALIEKNTYQGLDYFPGMLSSLRGIESAIGGFGNLVARSPGVIDGTDLGIATGDVRNNQGTIAKAFGGWVAGPMTALVSGIVGKTSKTIIDSGIQFGGNFNDLQAGMGYDQYASVDTTVKKWFGLSKNTTNSQETTGLNNELSNQFGLIFTGLEETLRTAATGLGLNADDVSKALDGLVLATTTLSLKDLKGEDLTAAINAVISKAMDEISVAAFPSFDQFRKVGEGYAETVVRIANNFQAINTVFASFGKTFDQVGVESVAARERLIEMSGGLEAFTSQGAYFLENFFSEKEQRTALKKRIDPTLEKYGLSTEGEGATKAFRDLVVGLKESGLAGAEAYTTLMKIAPAFMDIVKGGQAIFDQRDDLRNQLDELTMTPAQLAAKQRAKIDPDNVGLFDEIQRVSATNTAAASLAAANKTYQDQIDSYNKLIMTSTELRALEIEGMDASTVALYDIVAALKKNATEVAEYAAKAQAIKSANSGFQGQIDSILKTRMTPEELRAFETEGMDKSTIALYDRLTVLKAEEEAIRIAEAAAASFAAAQKQAAEESMRAAEALRDAWRSATDSILDEIARIRGEVDGGGKASLAGAQAEFTITSAQARAGDIEAAKLLPKLSQTLLELAESNASTSLDLQRIRAQTLASLVGTSTQISKKNGFSVPSFDVGTNFLPNDMFIKAHAGERIVPAADNRALFAAIDRSSAQSDPASREQARQDMDGLRSEVRAVAIHSAKTAALLSRVIENDVLKTQEQPA